MPANQYLPFANGAGANTLTPSAYNSNGLRPIGHQPGVALSEVMNTTLRQVSVAVAAVAQLAADYGSNDVLDNGVVNDFKVALLSALDALYLRDSDFAGAFATSFGAAFPTSFDGSLAAAFSTRLHASPGYQKLPNGLYIMWGFIGSTGGQASFPIPFPNNCFTVYATAQGTGGADADVPYAYVVDRTKFYIGTKGSSGGLSGYPCYWFAIGN